MRSTVSWVSSVVQTKRPCKERLANQAEVRLADAGSKSELFTADGLGLLHELTGGLLRSIDVLAIAALRLAAAEEQRVIDRDLVRRALHHTPLA